MHKMLISSQLDALLQRIVQDRRVQQMTLAWPIANISPPAADGNYGATADLFRMPACVEEFLHDKTAAIQLVRIRNLVHVQGGDQSHMRRPNLSRFISKTFVVRKL
jgi:hypothetical protein